MPSIRSRFLTSLLAAVLLGALIALLSSGTPFLGGWLAASVLCFAAIFGLSSAWQGMGGGRRLAWMVALAFGLRLALGIGLSLGLQAFGYDEQVNRAGYIYADAFTRDNDAWDLAQSDRPILSSFSQEIVSDQYGGALAMGAAVYRYLSPDAHRRFLILILSAFAAALGVPFFWQAVRRRWNAPLADLSTWILVLYPESVLLGGSQLREPYLIGMACIALWAVWGRGEAKEGDAARIGNNLSGLAKLHPSPSPFPPLNENHVQEREGGPESRNRVFSVSDTENTMQNQSPPSPEACFTASGEGGRGGEVFCADLKLTPEDASRKGEAKGALPDGDSPFASPLHESPLKSRLLAGGLALLVMALFSWRGAAVVAAMLALCAWLDLSGELRSRWLKLAGWAGLVLVGAGALGLSWSWIRGAGLFEANKVFQESGIGQYIVRQLGRDFTVPFFTAYGLAQPVLPAVLVDQAAWIWRVIGILRAAGWYALAPVLLYAVFAAWKAEPGRDRRMLVGLALGVLAWILISSLRAGGDQWDNPRYRTLFLPWMALLAGWGWLWACQKKDLWLWAWAAADGIFSLAFLNWYIGRNVSALKVSFLTVVGIVLVLVLLLGVGFWLWSLRRAKAAGKPLPDLLGLGRHFLALRADGEPAAPGRRWNRWDWLAAASFLGFALLYFLGRLQANYPIVLLGGDAGNIASYAAALSNPGIFALDPILGSVSHIGIYATLHLPLLRALEPLAGDFGLAYTWLLAPHILLQLLGFYILGRALFHNRLWAYLLAWITAMMVIDIGLGEVWGVWRDALPRVTFQALLPFLLALAVVWRSQPRRWPWLMLGAGLLVYAHPVSAPGWGLALWLGLWLNQPRDWKWARRLGTMFGLGLLFLLPMVPFALNYLSYRSGGSADYATLMPLMLKYFPENLLNVPAAFGAFVLAMSRNLLIPIALLGMLAAWLVEKETRPLVKLVLAWLAGILVVSILVPLGERSLEQAFHFLPLETELVRGIRYLVPLLLVFWLWPFSILARRLADPRARRAAVGLGLVLTAFWSLTHLPDARRLVSAAACLARAQLVCEGQRDLDELIVALRTRTQPGDGIFFFNQDENFTSNSLSVRYSALRPLVHSPRDQGILGYTEPAALPAWDRLTTSVVELRAVEDPQARLARILPIARSLKASYLILDFQVPPEGLASLPVQVVMQDASYLLLAIK